jgi:hypothetical protein
MKYIRKLKNLENEEKKLDKVITKIYNKCNAFYAFSEEQAKEQIKENINYIKEGCFFIEAGKKDKFYLELEEAYKNHRVEIIKNYTKDEIIFDALKNYECFYDRSSIDRAIEYVQQFNITEQEFLKVFKIQLKIYNETDEDIFFGNN